MDAENIDFAPETFDAVTCRFGLMFCPDPPRAAAAVLRVLKPGGRVALTVWDVAPKNTFFTAGRWRGRPVLRHPTHAPPGCSGSHSRTISAPSCVAQGSAMSRSSPAN